MRQTIFFSFPSQTSNHDFIYIHGAPEVLRIRNTGKVLLWQHRSRGTPLMTIFEQVWFYIDHILHKY